MSFKGIEGIESVEIIFPTVDRRDVWVGELRKSLEKLGNKTEHPEFL